MRLLQNIKPSHELTDTLKDMTPGSVVGIFVNSLTDQAVDEVVGMIFGVLTAVVITAATYFTRRFIKKRWP